ncbi:hypothetical protein JG661_17405 [Vibrio cholerae]|uniref:hypothetical protein n=2 Tax=Vibrio cholerae TaxID=666 RepID=UPI0018F07F83|nr:hypothetical protein [Vibrio cholerae]MBJ6911077.1 hypothetical protein [Vibrio cholerae]
MKSKLIESNYENFYAQCPFCKHSNIFNRRDDLKTFRQISRMQVTCQNSECKLEFEIGNDLINSPSEMLIMDAGRLIDIKSYMLSVIVSVQAVENHISQLLLVELIYKKYKNSNGLNKLNESIDIYTEKTSKYGFKCQANFLINYMLLDSKPITLEDSLKYISSLPDKQNTCKKDAITNCISIYKDLATDLYNTEIHKIRNKIAHKQALRPSRNQAEQVLEEASNIIDLSQNIFSVHSIDINSYINQNA